MSDIVFLRAWVPLPARRFFNPVMTHCIANPEVMPLIRIISIEAFGMQTLGMH